jgi:hypothetical protein
MFLFGREEAGARSNTARLRDERIDSNNDLLRLHSLIVVYAYRAVVQDIPHQYNDE